MVRVQLVNGNAFEGTENGRRKSYTSQKRNEGDFGYCAITSAIERNLMRPRNSFTIVIDV